MTRFAILCPSVLLGCASTRQEHLLIGAQRRRCRRSRFVARSRARSSLATSCPRTLRTTPTCSRGHHIRSGAREPVTLRPLPSPRNPSGSRFTAKPATTNRPTRRAGRRFIVKCLMRYFTKSRDRARGGRAGGRSRRGGGGHLGHPLDGERDVSTSPLVLDGTEPRRWNPLHELLGGHRRSDVDGLGARGQRLPRSTINIADPCLARG